MGILDRISLLLGSREQQELTSYLGLKSAAFSEWKSGKSKSYRKYLIEIAAFFNVSLDYLVFGRETVGKIELKKDENELLSIYNKLSSTNKARVIERATVLAELESPAYKYKHSQEENDTIFIEYSTLKVSAGTGEPLIDDSRPEFIEVKRSDLTEDANFAVQISGDSMLPRFHDQDIVLVRSQPDINIGEIGIFIIDGNGYIKEKGANRLISLNPEYDDIDFKPEQDIRCKGLVIATLEDDDFV